MTIQRTDRRLSLLMFFSFLLSLSLLASANQSKPKLKMDLSQYRTWSISELTQGANLIVKGVITSIDDNSNNIYTRITLDVQTSFWPKEEYKEDLSLLIWDSTSYPFKVGSQVIWFLKREDDSSSIVDRFGGYFVIRTTRFQDRDQTFIESLKSNINLWSFTDQLSSNTKKELLKKVPPVLEHNGLSNKQAVAEVNGWFNPTYKSPAPQPALLVVFETVLGILVDSIHPGG